MAFFDSTQAGMPMVCNLLMVDPFVELSGRIQCENQPSPETPSDSPMSMDGSSIGCFFDDNGSPSTRKRKFYS
jgi:hypothetical protein